MFLFLQLPVLACIAYLYIYLGDHLSYFKTVMWWDIPLHILGGLWLGFLAAYIAQIFGKKVSVFQTLMFSFAIGAGWEVFEYVNRIGGSLFMSYRIDTAKDLADDMIGGALAGLVAQAAYSLHTWRK